MDNDLKVYKEKLLKYCEAEWNYHNELTEINKDNKEQWHHAKRDAYEHLHYKIEHGYIEKISS